ncbi:MAG: methyltransferase domain-containing protein [Legionellaceae bacterium]|nr:methyltransferase domain-containing protein [Legionellaceae bacterium]
MCQWLMAKIYDNIMQDAEDRGLRDWRQQLLQNASGDVLELGCGTGANLEFYPDTVKRLVLIEPSVHMRKKLQTKLSSGKHANIELLNDKAECISLPDASFDAVVCTLVLCSVNHLEKTLSEIHRILRPQGKLFFIEHVAATNNMTRYKWQRRFAFLWKCIAAGCHITRHTENAIAEAGFNILEIERQSMRGVPTIVRPSIRGIAMKG